MYSNNESSVAVVAKDMLANSKKRFVVHFPFKMTLKYFSIYS